MFMTLLKEFGCHGREIGNFLSILMETIVANGNLNVSHMDPSVSLDELYILPILKPAGFSLRRQGCENQNLF